MGFVCQERLSSHLPEFGDTPVLGSSQVFSMHRASSVSDKPSDDRGFIWKRLHIMQNCDKRSLPANNRRKSNCESESENAILALEIN